MTYAKTKLQAELERRLREASLSEVSKEVSEFLRSKIKNQVVAYEQWFCNRSPEEYELHEKICLYEDQYFADMTLRKYARELMKVNLATGQSYIPTDILDDLRYALSGTWRVTVVEDNPEWVGRCSSDCLIEITKNHRNDKITILHEMIHAYETILDSYPMFKDWLMLRLHRELSGKIPNLHRYLSVNVHPYLFIDVFHGTLFALKSLDLDLRLKKPLGTVFAYGRDDLFK